MATRFLLRRSGLSIVLLGAFALSCTGSATSPGAATPTSVQPSLSATPSSPSDPLAVPEAASRGDPIDLASLRGRISFSDGTNDIWVVNADGSDQRRVLEVFAQFVDWSPDGEYLVFSPGLHLVRPDGTGLVSLSPGVSEPEFADWGV